MKNDIWLVEREDKLVVQMYESGERPGQFCVAVLGINGKGSWSIAYVTKEELGELADQLKEMEV